MTNVQIKDATYGNYEQTNEIFNDALINLNNLNVDSDKFVQRDHLKPRKKLKTRISCPHIISNNLYPNLDG